VSLVAQPWVAHGQETSPAEQPEVGMPDPAQTGRVLNLVQCVTIALDADLSLRVAEERRYQAQKDLTAARGAFLPDLSLSRTDVRDKRTDFEVQQFESQFFSVQTIEGPILPFSVQSPSDEVADETIESSYNDWQASTNWNLFAGFGKWSTMNSAKNSVRSALALEAYNRELVAQNVATAYYDLLRFEALLEVAEDTRDLAAKELERSETYFRLGSAAKSDVLQARVRLENTRLDVVVANNAVEQAFANLAYAMAQPLAQRFDIDRQPLETEMELEDLNALYQEAMQNRLDLQGQEYAVEAAKKDVTTATANLWPRLDLFASYVRYNNESPFRFGSQESENLRYGYRVTWNVFDRFQTLTGRSIAKANERIAEYTLEQQRLDAQREIRQLYNSLIEARERLQVSRETIIQSQEELRLAQERFRVGAGTSIDRILAEVNLATARGDEVQAICDFLIGRVQLNRAVGRISKILEQISS
jgi:outer membrane protein TolC